MIVVWIELWPEGDATEAEELGRMAIANEGPSEGGGKDMPCDYAAVIEKSPAMGAKGQGVWRSCKILGYPRASWWVGIWDLLRSGLDGCLDNPRPRPRWGSTPLESRRARQVSAAMRSRRTDAQTELKVDDDAV